MGWRIGPAAREQQARGPPAGSEVFKASRPHCHRSPRACELAKASANACQRLPLGKAPAHLHALARGPRIEQLATGMRRLNPGEEGAAGPLAKQPCTAGTG